MILHIVPNYTEACPSNYYKCDCFSGGDRAAFGSNVVVVAKKEDFTIGEGLCGVRS